MKVRSLKISPDLLLSWLTVGEHSFRYSVIKDGVPCDAELLSVRLASPHTIELLVESESFEDIPDGGAIPSANPILETHAYADHLGHEVKKHEGDGDAT